MATTRAFNSMLNEFLTNDLLEAELIKRDYMMNKIEKRNNWKGGTLVVPFKGSQASSISFGSLTASSSITQSQYVRGQITSQKEVWGSMAFDGRDLQEHNGKIPESTFLRILPDEVDSFMQEMKEKVSLNLLSGAYVALVTDSSGATSGDMIVDKIDQFHLGQALSLDDDNTSATDVYVLAININTSTVTLTLTSSATAGDDVSSWTAAQNAKLYLPGQQSAGFTSLRGALLSSANSGDSTIHGQTKTAYPYLQAVNIDGASITATNILDKIFDGYTDVRKKARGMANTILMSYKHLGSCMKLIETQKGGYKTSINATKASMYGWTEISITSVRGELMIVGVQEMPDDLIYFVDWGAMAFCTNGFFQKEVGPDGQQFFRERATTGYRYLVDIKCFGELMVHKPGNCGVIYGISY